MSILFTPKRLKRTMVEKESALYVRMKTSRLLIRELLVSADYSLNLRLMLKRLLGS
jgi:hypothetical protein